MRDDKSTVHDSDNVCREFFDKKQREFLKSIVSEEVIEEHKTEPLGQHSEPLERLLLYFRRAPQKDKYAITRNGASGMFRIVMLPGERQGPVALLEDAEYSTLEEAYHAVFMRRVRDLLDRDE